MLHLFFLSFKKWVQSRIYFAHLAGAELGVYSRASKCQIVIAVGAKPCAAE